MKGLMLKNGKWIKDSHARIVTLADRFKKSPHLQTLFAETELQTITSIKCCGRDMNRSQILPNRFFCKKCRKGIQGIYEG